MKELLKTLNPSQREAVLHFDSPLLVLAGAGSGKTRVITFKVAYMVKELRFEPERILAVTFTNKAAREMKERVEQLLGRSVPVLVSTFHSFCVRLLRRHAEEVGLSREFVILDGEDRKRLLSEVVKELNLDPERYSPSSLSNLVSNVKNGLYSLEGLSVEFDKFGQLFELYNRRLRELNAVDFDDLLLYGRELLSREEWRDYYSNYFRYVLVDEYQDTNAVQYDIVKALTLRKGNICAVGDDDQCIYSWRGANINNILSFERDFKNAKVIKLEQNYRCSKKILEAANAVIANNRERKGKVLYTENPEGDDIRLFRASSDVEEAQFLVAAVKRLIERGVSPSSIAVFYRTNALSRIFEDALRRAGIPYQIVGGVRFYERREVKDVIAYLRLAVSPSDLLSLLRVLNTPRRGLGPAVEAKVKELFAELKDAFEVLGRLSRELRLEKQRRGVSELLEVLERIREKVETLPPYDLVKFVVSTVGYEEFLKEEYPQEWEQRLENVLELGNTLQEFAEKEGLTGRELLLEFLSSLALSSDQDQLEEGQERVTLMTVHASKGLEFPVVFITALEEGIFPHSRSSGSPRELEEERRLFYVAVTRAKERLFLSYAKRRRVFGSYRETKPSRFLSEIPQHLLCEVRRRQRVAPSGSDPRVKARAPRPEGSAARPKLVYHPKFGKGVVKRVEGSGDSAKVTALFAGHGEKTIIMKFLKVLG
ncbi:ATP-dependent helicase [Thermovibrio ammonificans]|uniref:DNA 3'-5' helicase n=1 Tax=Thermovibrio ammonificans (strain DSM 15698 / JCM 12110 / HB-1) TaxID=648996 RepID=E8T3Y9_THEA1|nr:UvrD-helicase domain-containing protein [Thermovibrio ammonificans]ADU96199.1 UvrD/REP helicase [Thermovibrio ammonificans HB-1]